LLTPAWKALASCVLAVTRVATAHKIGVLACGQHQCRGGAGHHIGAHEYQVDPLQRTFASAMPACDIGKLLHRQGFTGHGAARRRWQRRRGGSR
jgi:hypothetical protein